MPAEQMASPRIVPARLEATTVLHLQEKDKRIQEIIDGRRESQSQRRTSVRVTLLLPTF